MGPLHLYVNCIHILRCSVPNIAALIQFCPILVEINREVCQEIKWLLKRSGKVITSSFFIRAFLLDY